MQSVCVYCGSSDRIGPAYLQAAFQMGKILADRSLRLVYGAGKTGLMGAVADGALAAGGEVYGVMPAMFYTPALAHQALTRLEITESMHTRKARMYELADAFIALPGGLGTYDELFETLTWAQIGLHHKPVGLLNTAGYFDPLLRMLEYARTEGMLYDEHLALYVHAREPGELLDQMAAHQPPEGLARWVDRPGVNPQ
jgi:hypothetical protein